MRGRPGSVTEISVSGLKILPYEHFILVAGMNSSQQRMCFMVDDVAARFHHKTWYILREVRTVLLSRMLRGSVDKQRWSAN